MPRLAAWRRDIHAHPELAFDEKRTAGLVAAQLRRCGIEVTENIAGTGVLGVLRCGAGTRAYAFRADMDALPVEETNTFGHKSQHAGRMHACGHDGHAAMLLGAAEYLATVRNFSGTLYFIFQPAEETCAGADAMLKSGLLAGQQVAGVFAMHNAPGLAVGTFNIWPGSVMAAASSFDIRVIGTGCHAAMPHQGVDSILVGSQLVVALQSVISRNVNPMDPAVLTVTQFRAGHAYNVSPEFTEIAGCVRSFSTEMDGKIERRLRELTGQIAAAFGAEAQIDYRRISPPLLNSPVPTRAAIELARQCVGAENVDETPRPSLGTDDFAFFAQRFPVCYVLIGNGSAEGGCTLHKSRYDFNDEILPLGILFWSRLAARLMPPGREAAPIGSS